MGMLKAGRNLLVCVCVCAWECVRVPAWASKTVFPWHHCLLFLCINERKKNVFLNTITTNKTWVARGYCALSDWFVTRMTCPVKFLLKDMQVFSDTQCISNHLSLKWKVRAACSYTWEEIACQSPYVFANGCVLLSDRIVLFNLASKERSLTLKWEIYQLQG